VCEAFCRKGARSWARPTGPNPFDYPVTDATGQTVRQDVSATILKRIGDLKLDAVVVIGGDGSLHIAQRFLEMGAPLVAVPKTIDNDVNGTDLTFGFDTALDIATEAIDRLHTTAESHHRVMLVEVMGRNAGWLALESGLAGGADIILLPEIPFDVNRIDAKIEAATAPAAGSALWLWPRAPSQRKAGRSSGWRPAHPWLSGWGASALWWPISWQRSAITRSGSRCWAIYSAADRRRRLTGSWAPGLGLRR